MTSAYTFHCPTQLAFTPEAPTALARVAAALPPGPAFVVTDAGVEQAGLVAPLRAALEEAGRSALVFRDVSSNPGLADVRAAVAAARALAPAIVVAVGGGSPIDVAKATALLLPHGSDEWEPFQWGQAPFSRPALPVIAVPTTAGTGSEVTHVAVIGDRAGFKKGLVHPSLFPHAAIVDAGLLRTLPPRLTAATGMDALTHALEAFLGQRANATTDLLALGALRVIVRWLPEATRHGQELPARRAMAQAAVWAGMAMDQAGLGLCHALCGPLTAHHHVHHGMGNAALLPAVMAFNAEAIPADGERWQSLRGALRLPAEAAPPGLSDWLRDFVAGLGLPASLGALDVDASNFDHMAKEATRMAMIGNNVRPAGAAECRAVLQAAL